MESARPLRIIHCFRSPVGGIFRHVRDLAAAQAAAGHQVGIVCDSSTGGAHEDRLFEQILPTLALGVRRTAMQRHIGPGDIASAWRTYRLLKGLKPDVLHGHGAKGGTYARMFGTLMRTSGHKVARLYSLHGGSLHYDETAVVGRLFFTLERVMERLTDRLLFVSDYERQAYVRKVGTPKVPFNLVYNGLAAAEFEPVPPAPGAADFLYIGMMRDLKGPDLFIDALAAVEKETGKKLTAAMVGAGDDLPQYKQQVAALGLAERVRFYDPLPARQAFALARTIVVPSRAEAMPYIVLEALAAGMPMVATSVGGIPEIFEGRDDALVEPEAAALAARMKQAYAEPQDYARLMPDLRDLRRRFGVETMARDIERAYGEALGGPPAKGSNQPQLSREY
jgi:glycosyltransferase involved in cell wall biosynthesis